MLIKKPDLTRFAAVAALLGSLNGCADSGGSEPPAVTNGEADPVEAAIAALGVPISGCDGTSHSGYSGSTFTLTLASDPLVLSTKNGAFTANGILCTHAVSMVQQPIKTTDVQKIVITGTTGPDKVILDFLPGTFGTKVLSAGGGITVDFSATNSPTTVNDSLMFRGGSLAETYKFGTQATSPYTDVWVELSGDKYADVDLKLSMAGTITLAASMGAGNDVVMGNPTTTDFDKFSVATPTLMVGPLPSTIGITAYGGPGDDKFTGGFGNDAFYGGVGNDTFTMNVASDGADIYSGDDGLDTIDYSNRTADLKVDFGPKYPAVEGNVDMRAPKLYGSGGLLDTKTLSFVIDGIRVDVPAFSAPADLSAVLTAINSAANTALGTMSVKYATLNANNHVVIASQNSDAAPFVKIEEDPAIALSTSPAETLLGLTVTTPVSPATLPAPSAMVTGADLSTSSLYGSAGSGTLTNRRLVLTINGVYVVTDFATPADGAAVVAAINSAANAALNTTSIVYAKLDSSSHLELDATPGIIVVDSTMAHTLPNSATRTLGLTSQLQSAGDIVNNTTLFPTSGTSPLDMQTLGVVIDGVRVETTFSAPTDANMVAAAINTAANTAFGSSSVTYAEITPSYQLSIFSPSNGANTSFVKIASNPVIIAGSAVTPTAQTAAEGVFGLTLNTGAATQIGSTDATAAALYGSSGTLKDTRMVLIVDGEYVVVHYAGAVTDQAAALAAINTAINTALNTTSVVYATIDMAKHLEIASQWIIVKPGAAARAAYTSAATNLELGPAANFMRTVADADDGIALEHDDVRYSMENILGGHGNDTLIGNDLKNTIKGNDGNDIISGGGNATCGMTDGDTLSGGAGDDTFLMPVINCRAALSGGDGNNIADFSGRTNAVTLKNNGTADDGESGENANVGTDITTLIGGFGGDTITGGASDDTLIGGPGADTLVGGAGNDTADFSTSPAAVTVNLCFATAIGSCMTDTDGFGAHDVAVYQVEHLIGSPFNDTLSGSSSTTVELVIEGGAGDDTITGGAANDTLWGDAGNDTLNGGDGDDMISGDAGDDALNGGNGDADICLGDSSDVTTPKSNCEL